MTIPPSSRARSTGDGGTTKQATVLLVEDDAGIASFITRALSALGIEGEWVSTGRAALEKVAGGGIATLILDLGLPDMDGMEVLRTLRGGGSPLPVIVITARNDPADRNTAGELGVVGYLRKPFPLAELLGAVRRSVDVGTVQRPD